MNAVDKFIKYNPNTNQWYVDMPVEAVDEMPLDVANYLASLLLAGLITLAVAL